MACHITCEAVNLATGSADREGLLVFADDALVAILVRLEDEAHEDQRGRWFLEAGLGPCATKPEPVFASPDDAQTWVRQRLAG